MIRKFFFFIFIFCVQYPSNGQNGKLIRSIYFEVGSYYIDEGQKNEFINFLDSIPNIQEYTITIHSHTDNIGGVAFNKRLSELRSWSAEQILVPNYAKEGAVEIQDFGQFNPLYDNKTQLGRYKNRRVDIIFWPISL